MRAGPLRHQLTIQSASMTRDGARNPTVTWSTVVTVRCDVVPQTSADPIAGLPWGFAVTHRITTRYVTGIKPFMRGQLEDGRILHLAALRTVDERQRTIELAALELGTTGAVTLSRNVRGTHSAAAGTFAVGSQVSASSYGVAGRLSPADRIRLAAKNWDVDSAVALMIDAAALGPYLPQPNDRLGFSGLALTVREVEPIAPDGIPVLYGIVGTA